MGECCHFHLALALLEGLNGPPWYLPGAIKTFKGNQKDLGYVPESFHRPSSILSMFTQLMLRSDFVTFQLELKG